MDNQEIFDFLKNNLNLQVKRRSNSQVEVKLTLTNPFTNEQEDIDSDCITISGDSYFDKVDFY